MNDTLLYLAEKFNLTWHEQTQIIEIPSATRKVMAEVLAETGLNTGVEVGVAQGYHAEILCQANPDILLHLVDPWHPYDGYNEYQDRITKYHLEAIERLEGYNCVFHQQFSMDAVKHFADNSLDFVYIDAAHDFKNVAMDMCEWTKKVRVGGIVFGHDYKRRNHNNDKYIVQVKDVAQAYMYAHGIRPWFVLGTQGNRGEGLSWMFVRQESDVLKV